MFLVTSSAFSPGAQIRFVIEMDHVDPSGPLHVTCEGHVVRIEPRSAGAGVGVSIGAYNFVIPGLWGAIPSAATEVEPTASALHTEASPFRIGLPAPGAAHHSEKETTGHEINHDSFRHRIRPDGGTWQWHWTSGCN